MTEGRDRRTATVGLLLAACIAAVYLATLNASPVPGDSAALLARGAGLTPFPAFNHPLWNGAVRIAKAIPFGTLALRMALFNVAASVLTLWIVFRMVAAIPHDRSEEERHTRFSSGMAGLISGAAAAVFLAFSTPFWLAATRAHPLPLGILLLTAAAAMTRRYASSSRPGWLYGIAFALGLGVVEFPTMILAAPILTLLILFLMLQNGAFASPKSSTHFHSSSFLKWAARLVPCFLAGFSVLFVYGAWLSGRPAMAWLDVEGAFPAIWTLVRDQYVGLKNSFPRAGALLIGLISALPLALVLSRKEVRLRERWSSWFLHLVLLGLAAVLAFELYVTPWALFADQPLVVTPYLLMAIWIGYLAGYWYAAPAPARRRDERSFVRAAARAAALGLLAVALTAAPAFRAADAQARSFAPTQRLAADAVESMAGRTWLVTDGVLDDLILLEAFERKQPIRLLNPRMGSMEPYRRYLSTVFESPRLKGLALLGLSPLLQEWFRQGRDAAAEAAVLGYPDLWLNAGWDMRPHGVLFFGAPPDAPADFDPAPLLALADAYAPGSAGSPGGRLSAGWNQYASEHVSKVLNNTGFLLEDRERPEDAMAAYRAALDVCPENASAFLNLYSLCRREECSERDALQKQFDEFRSDTRRSRSAWNVAYRFGYIRHPMHFVQRGMVWALSGRPGLGVQELRRAAAMGAGGENLTLMLAGMYFDQGKQAETEKLLLDVLKNKPDDPATLRGLARLEVRRGNYDAARGYIASLREAVANPLDAAVDEALVEWFAGREDRARDILMEATQADPDSDRAWTLLALVATAQEDQDLQDRCVRHFSRNRRRMPPPLLLSMARVAFHRRDLRQARDFTEQILSAQRNHIGAMEMLLRIDLAESRKAEAEEHVRALLSINPDHALANFVLGTLYYERRQFALAEAALRASADAQPAPETLNSLAYVLVKNGKPADALPLAEQALELNDADGAIWDTYGLALLRTGRVDEAREAFLKALALLQDDPEILFHLAQVHARTGRRAEAEDLVRDLLARAGDMPIPVYEDLRDFASRLREEAAAR
jgi:Tfp pilus assembly protein PilF